MASVYIHIPFCERICSYCDFPKRVGNPKQMSEYLVALEKEIDRVGVIEPLDTLYIGGGTPSILKGEALDHFCKIINRFTFKENYEFSIECNPEHITEDRLKKYQSIGVNRFSLGVQTFNAKILRLLNRNHDETIVRHAISLLKAHGFHNINIDLMFALPLQSLEDLYYDLEQFISLDLPHLSAYSLILEDKTVLSYLVSKDRVKLQENEKEALMYQIVQDTLKGAGYHHYEISNFAKKGLESRHNQVYWLNQTYYGFGMGASGYLNGRRYYNETQLLDYLKRIEEGQRPIKEEDEITNVDRLKEAFMLGLRLIDGVDVKLLSKTYGVDLLKYFEKELQELLSQGWITIDDRVRLTPTGLFYGNEVFGTFL